jgi:DNA-binding MarR family transcriptional regulator
MSENLSLPHVLRQWALVFMRRSFRDLKRFMDEAGLSPSQGMTLMRLHHCGALGVSDIAEEQGITVPAASQQVERLVQQGLLERTEDPHDRRFKQVTLSRRGHELVENSLEARVKWMEELAESLPTEQQQHLIDALSLLTEAASRLDARSSK